MSDPISTRDRVRSAIGFWEPARVVYNLLLVTTVIVRFSVAQDPTQPFLRVIPSLFGLAVIANVLYCAAYVVDFVAQLGDYAVRPIRWRIPIWIVGTAFAVLLASDIAAELFVVSTGG